MAKQTKAAKPKAAPKEPASDEAKTADHAADDKTKTKTKTKSKRPFIVGAVTVAILIIIGVIVATICNNSLDPSDPRASLSYSRSFFIFDHGKYTLWNADGDRLTEDEYDSRSDFIAGHAYVYKDKQAGIIDENGNMSVEFGKYGSITAKGGLYLAQDGNTKAYQVLTGTGSVLEEGDDLEISTGNSSSPFAVIESKEKVNVYTCNGNLITSVDVTDDKEDVKLSSSSDFGSFHYGNQNVIFDARNNNILATFEDDSSYRFDSVSDDRSIIILEKYNDSDKYKLLANGQLYDLDELKYYSITMNNNVIGYDNYSELALLNNDYKIERRVSTYLDLKDTNNFAYRNKDRAVEIWQNGEKIKTIDNADIAASGILFENYYAIEEGDKANFYNLDGSVAFNHDFKDIYSLFDENHHAIVSDEENKYYLIDTSGNQVGDYTARHISSRDGGYEFRNDEGNYAVADETLSWISDYKYESLYHRSTAVGRNLWTGRLENDNYDLIDVENHKNIVEDINIQSVYENYFTAKNDDGVLEYYTLDGKHFYTVSKDKD